MGCVRLFERRELALAHLLVFTVAGFQRMPHTCGGTVQRLTDSSARQILVLGLSNGCVLSGCLPKGLPRCLWRTGTVSEVSPFLRGEDSLTQPAPLEATRSFTVYTDGSALKPLSLIHI